MPSPSTIAMEDEGRDQRIADERTVREEFAAAQQRLREAQEAALTPPVITRAVPEGGDWEAWYRNGRRLDGPDMQTHSVDPKRILEALGFQVETLEVTDEWLEEQGEFPPDLGSIPPEVRTS
jgi:hypothetical protein